LADGGNKQVVAMKVREGESSESKRGELEKIQILNTTPKKTLKTN
jgi:hypothetical protein